MAKIDSAKFIRYLEEKWGARPCPMCGRGPWGVQDSTFQLMEYLGGPLALGGPLVPVVPVVCGNCGNTVLVSAITAGIVDPKEPPKPEGGK